MTPEVATQQRLLIAAADIERLTALCDAYTATGKVKDAAYLTARIASLERDLRLATVIAAYDLDPPTPLTSSFFRNVRVGFIPAAP